MAPDNPADHETLVGHLDEIEEKFTHGRNLVDRLDLSSSTATDEALLKELELALCETADAIKEIEKCLSGPETQNKL